MSSTAHYRHPLHEEHPKPETSASYQHERHDEESPLMIRRHLSMEEDEINAVPSKLIDKIMALRGRSSSLLSFAAALLILLAIHHWWSSDKQAKLKIVPIYNAQETWLDIDHGNLQLWYRTWGNYDTGIPVLFVHGGPGNAIADYDNGNARFFDPHTFFVVEVDQRGTGNSQPSVREDWRNMQYYQNISIDQMSHDFELVRTSLSIDKWLVWGGSWGSTLSLDYGMRYPERCLALILRGIYLNTVPEFDAVFSRRPYLNHPKRLHEFDTWFALAAEDALQKGEEPLDPNDSERFFRIYERMIERGDRNAIWHYHVFENNLMEEDPANLLDPNVIEEDVFPEAQSVAFFETRLFLHGTFEVPVNLLSRIESLRGIHTWICQGNLDEVCPVQYAHELVKTLIKNDVPHTARFLVNAGHEDTDPIMEKCLHQSLRDFLMAEDIVRSVAD